MNRKCVIPFILMLSAMCAPAQNAEAFQLFSLPVQSSAPADYYEQAQGKTGEALKRALHDTIDDHRELSYSEVWEALKATDEDPANRNNVILLYSRESRSKQANGGKRAIGTASTYGQNRTVISGQAKDPGQICITSGPAMCKLTPPAETLILTKAAAPIPELPETTMTAIPGNLTKASKAMSPE